MNGWQSVWREYLNHAVMAPDLPNNQGKNVTHWSAFHPTHCSLSDNEICDLVSACGLNSARFVVLTTMGVSAQKTPATNHARSAAADRETSGLHYGNYSKTSEYQQRSATVFAHPKGRLSLYRRNAGRSTSGSKVWLRGREFYHRPIRRGL